MLGPTECQWNLSCQTLQREATSGSILFEEVSINTDVITDDTKSLNDRLDAIVLFDVTILYTNLNFFINTPSMQFKYNCLLTNLHEDKYIIRNS